jgi:hypothetical protein
MILQWFATADATELGKNLAKTYLEGSQKASHKSQKKQQKKNAALLQSMASQIHSFKSKHKLNFYKKAKVANAFKWTLIDAGCNLDEIDDITRDLILLMR